MEAASTKSITDNVPGSSATARIRHQNPNKTSQYQTAKVRSSLALKSSSKLRASTRKLGDSKRESLSGLSPTAALSWDKQSHHSEDDQDDLEHADGREAASIGSKYTTNTRRKHQRTDV
jgi:hypothetical protein